MTSSQSVSVIIPVYNGAETIGPALNALLNQIDPPRELEIIVVDNGSIDQTREIVSTFEVTLLTEPQRGPSPARNRGLDAAHGEIIVYLDADMFPTRQWLREIIKPFVRSDVLMVGGATYSYKPETAAQRYIAQVERRAGRERTIGRCTFPFVSSQNMAVRREGIIAIGGWAIDMPTSEDTDFCWRFNRKFPDSLAIQTTAIAFHRDRATVAELLYQAFSYGEGLAHMYLKYPEFGRWTIFNSIQVLWVLSKRRMSSTLMNLGAALGLISPDRAELIEINSQWTQSHWRGFMSMYRHHQRRANLSERPER